MATDVLGSRLLRHACAAWLCLLPACSTTPGGTASTGSTAGCEGHCARSSTATASRRGSGTTGGSSAADGGSTSSSAGSSGSTGSSSGPAASSTSTSASSSTASAASSAASTATAGGSSSGGASTSTGAGDGGGLFVCGDASGLPDGGSCASGSFVTEAVDLFSCAPIVGGTVQALDAQGVPLPGSVTTAANGTFVLCGPNGGAFTPYLTATGYVTMYYGELVAGVHSRIGYVPAMSTSELGFLDSFLPGFGATGGTLLVDITSSPACPDPSGWTLSLTDGDGGALADGGYLEVYLGSSGLPEPAATATTGEGIAVFYDVDLSATSYFSVGATKPDAGGCGVTLNHSADFTGRIFITDNALSLAIFEVP